MSDLGLLNFGNEELDYDENEIENIPEMTDNDVTKKNSESEGEISDDGEIKSGKIFLKFCLETKSKSWVFTGFGFQIMRWTIAYGRSSWISFPDKG